MNADGIQELIVGAEFEDRNRTILANECRVYSCWKTKSESVSSSSIKVAWARTKGAKGYQVYMAASKHGRYKKIKTVKSYKKLNCTKAGLNRTKNTGSK